MGERQIATSFYCDTSLLPRGSHLVFQQHLLNSKLAVDDGKQDLSFTLPNVLRALSIFPPPTFLRHRQVSTEVSTAQFLPFST